MVTQNLSCSTNFLTFSSYYFSTCSSYTEDDMSDNRNYTLRDQKVRTPNYSSRAHLCSVSKTNTSSSLPACRYSSRTATISCMLCFQRPRQCLRPFKKKSRTPSPTESAPPRSAAATKSDYVREYFVNIMKTTRAKFLARSIHHRPALRVETLMVATRAHGRKGPRLERLCVGLLDWFSLSVSSEWSETLTLS
jgi:hypothetical protein